MWDSNGNKHLRLYVLFIETVMAGNKEKKQVIFLRDIDNKHRARSTKSRLSNNEHEIFFLSTNVGKMFKMLQNKENWNSCTFLPLKCKVWTRFDKSGDFHFWRTKAEHLRFLRCQGPHYQGLFKISTRGNKNNYNTEGFYWYLQIISETF